MKMNDFYKVTAQADKTKAARLDLFGVIGGGFWEDGFDENAFKAAMGAVDDSQPLDIYINSPGGSVFAAMAIHSMISRHAGPVTITVAGLAASAATIITSAKNARVIMPTGSMMMVHEARVSTDTTTADGLRNQAASLDKINESIRDIYRQKTGMDDEKLKALLKTDTFLTAVEAKELGFADEVDTGQVITNTMTGDTVMINGLSVAASMFAGAPAGFINQADTAQVTSAVNPSKEDDFMDLQKLKAEHPELVEAIRKEAFAEGVKQERDRIKAIEEIAVVGHDEMVRDAKFTNAISAEKLAVAILKADKERGAQMLANRQKDAAGLDSLGTEGNQGMNPEAEKKAKEEAEMKAVIEAGKRGFARN